MNKQRLLKVLLAALFIALVVTVIYGVEFYQAVQKINAIESAECGDLQQ